MGHTEINSEPTAAPLEEIMPRVIERYGGDSYTLASGNHARVAIVYGAEQPYVVKTRTSPDVKSNSHYSSREHQLLSYFANAGKNSPPPLELPRPLYYSHQPLYVVQSKISGERLGSWEEQASLLAHKPLRTQREVGGAIGSLIAWKYETITPETFMGTILEHTYDSKRPFVNFDTFYEQHLAGFESTAHPTTSGLANELWGQYRAYYPNGSYRTGDRVIHFDLQVQNMTAEDGKLVGVYDWEVVDLGDVNQELRGAYHMGPHVLSAAISKLHEHHIGVDPERVAFWGNLRTIGILAFHIARGSTDSQIFNKAACVARQIYPDEDWGELRQPS